MPPIIRINDTFQEPDGTNLNDYNNWQGYNFNLTPTDNIVFNDNSPEFTDTGGKVMIKTIPDPIFNSSDINCVGDFVFFNSDVVHIDNSFILFCEDTSTRQQITNTGIRIQIRRRIGQDNQFYIAVRNGGTLVDSTSQTFPANDSLFLFQFTLNAANDYNLLVSQSGRSARLAGTFDSPVSRNGRQYVFYTDLNGVVSGTNECWTTIDRLFMNETLHGSYKIFGHVYRHNLPLAGARVTCVTHSDDTFCQRRTTDSEGFYSFDDLKQDQEYDVMASYLSGGAAYTNLARAGVVPLFTPD